MKDVAHEDTRSSEAICSAEAATEAGEAVEAEEWGGEGEEVRRAPSRDACISSASMATCRNGEISFTLPP